jgi:hypothetical protein
MPAPEARDQRFGLLLGAGTQAAGVASALDMDFSFHRNPSWYGEVMAKGKMARSILKGGEAVKPVETPLTSGRKPAII